jgi:hypothetical protein
MAQAQRIHLARVYDTLLRLKLAAVAAAVAEPPQRLTIRQTAVRHVYLREDERVQVVCLSRPLTVKQPLNHFVGATL